MPTKPCDSFATGPGQRVRLAAGCCNAEWESEGLGGQRRKVRAFCWNHLVPQIIHQLGKFGTNASCSSRRIWGWQNRRLNLKCLQINIYKFMFAGFCRCKRSSICGASCRSEQPKRRSAPLEDGQRDIWHFDAWRFGHGGQRRNFTQESRGWKSEVDHTARLRTSTPRVWLYILVFFPDLFSLFVWMKGLKRMATEKLDKEAHHFRSEIQQLREQLELVLVLNSGHQSSTLWVMNTPLLNRICCLLQAQKTSCVLPWPSVWLHQPLLPEWKKSVANLTSRFLHSSRK